MDMFFSILPLSLWIAAFAIAVLAGVVKGIVGFAMPMILLSGLSTFTTPELALAGLLLPTLVTNAMQVLRYGLSAVWDAVKRFRVFLAVGAVMIFSSAQLVPILSTQALLLGMGAAVTFFALWQLSGRAPAPGNTAQSPRLDALVGAFAGFVGGISGMWGPPTVAYLTAIGTEKRQQMLAQGVIYGLGAVLLVIAHTHSGILNAQTLPFSLALLLPAILGMWIGARISDRVDQATFRKVTLIVLIISGLNLLRRGFFG
ncbi:MAG: sulfite exporter TauE/SafE family protein [Planktotalea sp.]|uniref:sulfite exporter TauE/SafE family protein n=1 Tax=Planktotalea sp. TaxID=2029877 RepID=UPI003C7436B4